MHHGAGGAYWAHGIFLAGPGYRVIQALPTPITREGNRISVAATTVTFVSGKGNAEAVFTPSSIMRPCQGRRRFCSPMAGDDIYALSEVSVATPALEVRPLQGWPCRSLPHHRRLTPSSGTITAISTRRATSWANRAATAQLQAAPARATPRLHGGMYPLRRRDLFYCRDATCASAAATYLDIRDLYLPGYRSTIANYAKVP